MNFDRKDLLLYAVTDRTWLGERRLKDAVRDSLDGGVTFVQLREKNMDRQALVKEALEIKELCREYRVPFVIDDDVDAAIEIDADGVHVGQDDMEAGNARVRLGPDKIVGVSAHNVEEALIAEKSGASYLGVGAAFGTGTKKDATKISLDTIKAICSAVKIPVIAIGGITEENVHELAGTGISGVAVVSAVYGKKDIKSAAERLRKAVSDIVTE